MLPACGTSDPAAGDPSTDAAADQDTTLNDGAVFTSDTAGTDAAADIAGDDVSESDGGVADAGETQVSECPGGPGCACVDNTGCDNGICIERAQGKRCAHKCVDGCEPGYGCTPFSIGGGDNVLICAPTRDWLCDPCTESAQCKHPGLEAAVCVDYDGGGGFCGAPCTDDASCPTGYACKPVQSVEGAGSKQCVRDEAGKLGVCECSDAAKDKKLSTTCKLVHKDDNGQVAATCPGVRTCSSSGLSKCIGPPPSAEVCDGADNDCNGQTDENACDDNNACTADACDAAAAKDGKGGCQHNKLDGPCDADGSNCTEADACQAGVCVPGAAKNCDDGNECTLDACDPAAGCTKTGDDGKACDGDGNPCTVGDSCVVGVCATGKPKNCDANDPCAIAKCQPATGKCAFSTKGDDTPCDDASLCTTADVCAQGFCKGKAITCDDGNGCTVDSCSDAAGCQHSSASATCDDANACTASDSCKDGACVGLPITATDCSDGDPCTQDACDPGGAGAVGKGCIHPFADGAPCEDGALCTENDACKTGKCLAGIYVCECQADADCAAKNDADKCNGSLKCDVSAAKPVCKLDPATVVSCGPATKPCLSSGCSKSTGLCALAHHPAGTSCDDGDACTVGDACQGTSSADASCKPGASKSCDDGNVCTKDACDKTKGCGSTIDLGHVEPCFSGPKANAGVGECTLGKRACTVDGTLDSCAGDKLPAVTEKCDGFDDDCDGTTDEGCGVGGWRITTTSARLGGAGAKYELDLRAGDRAAGIAAAGARSIVYGVRGWLKAGGAK